MSENRSDRTRNLWKDQDMQAQTFTPEMLARNARGLETQIRGRNRFEYLAGGTAFAFFAAIATLLALGGIADLADAISLFGLIAMMVGTATVLWQIHARTGAPRATDGGQPSLAALRAELVRQRDALRKVWLWYLLPFTPGLFLIYGADLFRPDGAPLLSLALLAGTLGVVAFIFWLNLRAADRMQAEIDRIDADLMG